jgi:hypothetical protein
MGDRRINLSLVGIDPLSAPLGSREWHFAPRLVDSWPEAADGAPLVSGQPCQ